MAKNRVTHADDLKHFTRAEIERLRAKVENYRKAVADYEDWLAFLRQQHEAEDAELWLLGEQGFVRKPDPSTGPTTSSGETSGGTSVSSNGYEEAMVVEGEVVQEA